MKTASKVWAALAALVLTTGCPVDYAYNAVELSDGLSFNMVEVPGAAAGAMPVGFDDAEVNAEAIEPFLIGETEITYALWKTVYDWATDPARSLERDGIYFNFFKSEADHDQVYPGDGFEYGFDENHPATRIIWRDAVVWCNALTMYYNAHNGSEPDLTVVYRGGELTTFDIPQDTDATGFRLPTSLEWECAARYIDGKRWTPGNYASGATAPISNLNATSWVAWFQENTGKWIQYPKQKRSNSLGLYDMSGNVEEWCFDELEDSDYRVVRGGKSFLSLDQQNFAVGHSSSFFPDGRGQITIRLARTLRPAEQ